jgi:threonine/homoserine/homoserine lactone efflux protein
MTLTYVATAVAMICIPGPDMLLVSGYALQRGPAAAGRAIAGIASGYLLVTAALAAGVGAVVAARPGLLEVLRWLAVAYLLWLARGALASGRGGGEAGAVPRVRGEWRDGLLTAALNPKGLLFFLALLPPFVDPDRAATPQLLVLGFTFCLLAVLVYGTVALAAARARGRLPAGGGVVGRASAVTLLAAAVLVAWGPLG